ncbi:MAG: MaoC family dehydratase [Bryobacteraceae bacterium]
MSEPAPVPHKLYLEDLNIGQSFTSAAYVLEEAAIKAFAAEFDPQPFHLENAAAEASVFKGLAASGWHTTAIAMRLIVDGGIPLAGGIIGLGADVQWPRPTRPGDVLTLEAEIAEITPSRSKPNQAVVTVRCTMFNQNREPVMYLTPKLLVFKRDSAPSEPRLP